MKNASSKWRVFQISGFVLGWILVGLTHPYAEEKPPIPKMTWQYSSENLVKVGIRNKYGWLDSYEVTFVIKQPNKKEVRAERIASGDEWICVYFPDDFATFVKPGKHVWRAVVEGHAIAKGTFEYTSRMGIK